MPNGLDLATRAASGGVRARHDPGNSTTCSGALALALRLAWGLLALVVLVTVGASFVALAAEESLGILFKAGVFAIDSEIARGLQDLGIGHDLLLNADLGFRLLGFTVFAVTAGVIFLRKADDWMTARVSALLLALGAAWFAPLTAIEPGTLAAPAADLLGSARPFSAEFGRSLAAPLLMLFLFLFPDGRFVPSWTRVAALVLLVHFGLWVAFPGSAVDVLTWPVALEAGVVGAALGLGLAAQVYRYFLASSPLQRQQTKLVVGALGAASATVVLLLVLNPGLGAGLSDLTLVTPRVEALYNLFLLGILGATLLLLPLSIGASVLRYRLWDIDLFINRTLVYGLSTGILAAAYVGIVAAAGLFVRGNLVAVAAATLLVAAAFQPLRRHVQDLIDRNFYRRRYDAARTIEAFSARLREEVDLDSLAVELLEVIDETILPTGVSLWLPANPDGVIGSDGETIRRLAFRAAGGEAAVTGPDFDSIAVDEKALDILKRADGPLALEPQKVGESETLSAFHAVLVRVAVPLVIQGELVGIINLGPRRSETDYSTYDLRLLRDLAGHAAAAVRVALLVLEHEADLRAKQRLENEMQVAQLIQRQFLPKELPRLDGWEIFADYRPARDVGGDFYDFVTLSDGRVAIIVGDVTGKGVPAALVMATTRSMLRGEARRVPSAALILEQVNDQLVADIPPSMFVTCLCVVLDPVTGAIEYANAGHNLPYLRSAAGIEEVRATGMPLGLMEGMTYEQRSASLAPGQSLVLHSDGLAEAHGLDREMFGFPRLKSLIAACGQPRDMIGHILDGFHTFTGRDWEQEDDITLVVVHRLDGSAELEPAPAATVDRVGP